MGTGAQRDSPLCLPHAYAIHDGEKEKTMQTLCLLGGLGLGAGLMYLLDPQQGETRRDLVRGSVVAGSGIKIVHVCFDVVPPRVDRPVLCHG